MSFEQELDEVLSELREMVLEKNWRKNGMTNFERYKYRKATKEHVCGLCQQTIPEGDVYLCGGPLTDEDTGFCPLKEVHNA